MRVFVAGARIRHLVVGTLAGGGLGLVLIMSQGYRKARLLTFLHPMADRTNAGWLKRLQELCRERSQLPVEKDSRSTIEPPYTDSGAQAPLARRGIPGWRVARRKRLSSE